MLAVQGDVERVARSLVGGSRADADDLVQDTFLRAIRGFHRFQEGTNFKAWILTLLRTAHIDRYRWQKRRPWILCDDALASTPCAPPPEPRLERYVDSHEERHLQGFFDDRMQHALASLPDNFRSVLLLSNVAGLGCKEIAKALACASGTVKSRLSRAKDMMRSRLESEVA